jgi:hypothetical protein
MFVYYLLLRGCNFELKTYELPEIRRLFILYLYQLYNDPDNNGSLVKWKADNLKQAGGTSLSKNAGTYVFSTNSHHLWLDLKLQFPLLKDPRVTWGVNIVTSHFR